jgi:hypothetical protein
MASKRERHLFRTFFRLALFAGIMVAIARFLSSKKVEYSGLTESEARARIEAKLAAAFGENKATEIADQVIPILRDRGMLRVEVG